MSFDFEIVQLHFGSARSCSVIIKRLGRCPDRDNLDDQEFAEADRGSPTIQMTKKIRRRGSAQRSVQIVAQAIAAT